MPRRRVDVLGEDRVAVGRDRERDGRGRKVVKRREGKRTDQDDRHSSSTSGLISELVLISEMGPLVPKGAAAKPPAPDPDVRTIVLPAKRRRGGRRK